MLSFDAFAAHLTDGIKNQLLEGNSNILAMPADCASKCQPINICLNEPFKTILRKYQVKHVSTVVGSFAEACNDSSFKLPVPTCRYIADWVNEQFHHLAERPEMVKRSFEVCSISSSDSLKVHNVSFYCQCMEKVQLGGWITRKQRRFVSFDCRRLNP